MTGLAFVGGTDISAIKNKEFLRIETDKHFVYSVGKTNGSYCTTTATFDRT